MRKTKRAPQHFPCVSEQIKTCRRQFPRKLLYLSVVLASEGEISSRALSPSLIAMTVSGRARLGREHKSSINF